MKLSYDAFQFTDLVRIARPTILRLHLKKSAKHAGIDGSSHYDPYSTNTIKDAVKDYCTANHLVFNNELLDQAIAKIVAKVDIFEPCDSLSEIIKHFDSYDFAA